jgi:hypothetical protein
MYTSSSKAISLLSHYLYIHYYKDQERSPWKTIDGVKAGFLYFGRCTADILYKVWFLNISFILQHVLSIIRNAT